MKYHQISPAPKLVVRRSTAVAMLEGADILERMESHGWVEPILRQRQMQMYSVRQLASAVRRMERETLPD